MTRWKSSSSVERLIDNIGGVTSEGFLYRVDMRLRPWGRDGFLVTTLDGYLQYIQAHARLWEKQALLKARPIAGDIELGKKLLASVEPIFSIMHQKKCVPVSLR